MEIVEARQAFDFVDVLKNGKNIVEFEELGAATHGCVLRLAACCTATSTALPPNAQPLASSDMLALTYVHYARLKTDGVTEAFPTGRCARAYVIGCDVLVRSSGNIIKIQRDAQRATHSISRPRL